MEANMPEYEILPYKAINVYIDQEYMQKVTTEVLSKVGKLPKQDQINFSHFMRKHITVLGFRDSSRAPLQLQINALVKAFEEKDEVVPFVLSIWAKINKKFAKEVKTWLDGEGWKGLATEREFDEEAGFTEDWPKKREALSTREA